MHNKRVKLTQTLDGTIRIIMTVCLMVIAAAFIVYGIFDGEINAVLSKATALCRECVGIG